MRLERFYDKRGATGVSGLWSLYWTEGISDGAPADVSVIAFDGNAASAVYGPLRLTAVETCGAGEVCTRDDTIENISDHPVTVLRCASRFALPDGEYDYYTQAHGWENESEGGWSPLIARAAVENRGVRGDMSAAPVLALRNRQNGRGTAFHVFPSAAWKMTASVESLGEENRVTVEIGVNDKGLMLTLQPGEKIALPKIVWYTFRDARDLECERLHRWFLERYPRRTHPVIFNSWLMTFDRIEPAHIANEAKLAADMGAEYFVIDAGWFGVNDRWHNCIGAWQENTAGAFRGKMNETADTVRALGMKFGLWFEIERALPNVPIVKEHPEWFFFNGREYFVNFGNDAAREYYFETISALIRRYGIEFIKFDFNADIAYDPSGCGFLRWHAGHERFLRDIREAFPGIYLENCASGGMRMDMYASTIYDSCWISDNQSLYHGLRILKESALRMPLSCIERWPVLKDAHGFMNYNTPELQRKLIACDDATWDNARSVQEDWLQAFVVGGPLGFSFDLEAVAPETLAYLKGLVETYKAERESFRNCTASVLCDTNRVTALQFTEANGDIRVCLYAWSHRQSGIDLYPVLEDGASYLYEGKPIEDGCVSVNLPATLHAAQIKLRKV